MKELAQGLASLGRNGDSMLVHMTPKEVQGLQQLALAKGGSLTVNPHTGLPEAGFLEDILPAAVGIGANFLFPGLGAIGTGLATGLTSYALNRNPNQALMSGLLSGGLSGLSGGLEKVGSNAALDIVDPLAMGPQLPSSLGTAAPAQTITPSATEAGYVRDPVSGEYAWQQAQSGYPQNQVAPTTQADIDKIQQAQPTSFGTPGSFTSPYTKVVSYQNPEILGSQKLGDMVAGWDKVTSSGKNAMDFLSANGKSIAAAGLGALGMMAPQQAAMPGAQAKTGYAPRYTWNPQTRQYENAAPYPYTYYAAGGGEVPYPSGTASYPQSRIEGMAYSLPSANPVSANVVGALPKTDYDARITQQGDVFTAAAGGKINSYRSYNNPLGVNEPNEPNPPVKGFKAGGPYGSAGPIYGVAGPIYGAGSTLSSKIGPYQNSDVYSAVKSQMSKVSPSILDKYAKGAKDPIVMAAAQNELYDRQNAPHNYIDQPYMQAAQGGTIKMADGGLFGALTESPEFQQLLKGSIAPAPAQYSYDPADQTYAQQAAAPQGSDGMFEDGGFLDLIKRAGILGPADAKAKQYSYDPKGQSYAQNMAAGGIASLPNEYAAGGKLLQGPGDGMSDSIPAVIKGPRPQRAALAQGEFVVPADVVSHLGNGSTDAGAKRLYSMMDKIRMARTGTKKQGRQINPEKFMPA